MHNDAVVQGLSEVPYMKDVERWGVLTIGTGLGNARFTNRKPAKVDRQGTPEAAVAFRSSWPHIAREDGRKRPYVAAISFSNALLLSSGWPE